MLTASEKSEIVELLALKKSILEITKNLKQDHRTVKGFVNDGKEGRKNRQTKSDHIKRFKKNKK